MKYSLTPPPERSRPRVDSAGVERGRELGLAIVILGVLGILAAIVSGGAWLALRFAKEALHG